MIGIYKITSPSGKIYIGSSKNIDKRKEDYRYKRFKYQVKLKASINKYGWENHIFEIIEECEFTNLHLRERYWQEYYNCIENGLNCVYTKTDTQPKILSEETKSKMKAHLQKRILKNEQPANKAILQYDLNGNFIKEWISFKEIRNNLGFCDRVLIDVCKGRKISACGFVWRYKTSNYLLKIEVPKKPINQLLIQYDKEMNIINEFKSVMDAYKSTNISRTAIVNNLSGLSKSAGGFIWKYKQLNN